MPGLPFSVLDRYLLQELMIPLGFGIGLFTALGVVLGMGFDLLIQMEELGIPPIEAGQVFVLKIPEFFVLSFPVSMLLAALLAYGRLVQDNELIALQSCSISLLRLMVAPIALGLMMAGVTMAINETIVPEANYAARQILETYWEEPHPYTWHREIFYPEYTTSDRGETMLQRLVYAKEVRDQVLLGVTVIEFSHHHPQTLLMADQAQWQHHQWQLTQGRLYQLGQESSDPITNIQRINFPPLLFELIRDSRDPLEMNIAQSVNYLRLLELGQNQEQVLKFKVRLHQRIATPFSTVCFTILGLGVAVGQKNYHRATAFGLCILLMFNYYLLISVLGALGLIGQISPWLCAWLPNLITAIGAIVLLRKNYAH